MYELTDDEKRRIREEEEAAAERDRYRAFVRGEKHLTERVDTRRFAWWEKLVLGVLACCAFLVAGVMLFDHLHAPRLRSEISARTLDHRAVQRKAAHAARLREFHDAVRSGRVGGDAAAWVERIDQIRDAMTGDATIR